MELKSADNDYYAIYKEYKQKYLDLKNTVLEGGSGNQKKAQEDIYFESITIKNNQNKQKIDRYNIYIQSSILKDDIKVKLYLHEPYDKTQYDAVKKEYDKIKYFHKKKLILDAIEYINLQYSISNQKIIDQLKINLNTVHNQLSDAELGKYINKEIEIEIDLNGTKHNIGHIIQSFLDMNVKTNYPKTIVINPVLLKLLNNIKEIFTKKHSTTQQPAETHTSTHTSAVHSTTLQPTTTHTTATVPVPPVSLPVPPVSLPVPPVSLPVLPVPPVSPQSKTTNRWNTLSTAHSVTRTLQPTTIHTTVPPVSPQSKTTNRWATVRATHNVASTIHQVPSASASTASPSFTTISLSALTTPDSTQYPDHSIKVHDKFLIFDIPDNEMDKIKDIKQNCNISNVLQIENLKSFYNDFSTLHQLKEDDEIKHGKIIISEGKLQNFINTKKIINAYIIKITQINDDSFCINVTDLNNSSAILQFSKNIEEIQRKIQGIKGCNLIENDFYNINQNTNSKELGTMENSFTELNNLIDEYKNKIKQIQDNDNAQLESIKIQLSQELQNMQNTKNITQSYCINAKLNISTKYSGDNVNVTVGNKDLLNLIKTEIYKENIPVTKLNGGMIFKIEQKQIDSNNYYTFAEYINKYTPYSTYNNAYLLLGLLISMMRYNNFNKPPTTSRLERTQSARFG